MVSIIVSVIFFGSMMLQCLLFVKLFSLLNKLKDRDIKISRWSGYAAKRDLRLILNSTNDNEIKEIVIKILYGIRQRHRLFFGSMGVIILVFILNGVFK
jgi:hypothetical protein